MASHLPCLKDLDGLDTRFLAPAIFGIYLLARPLSPHLPKSHTDTAAVVLDEFDPRRFKGVTDHDQGCPPGLIYACFQLADGHDPHLGFPCEILLAAAPGPAWAGLFDTRQKTVSQGRCDWIGRAEKNKNALKHGVFTKEAIEEWKQFQALIGQTRKMLQYFK
jgi:hypothetical protein